MLNNLLNRENALKLLNFYFINFYMVSKTCKTFIYIAKLVFRFSLDYAIFLNGPTSYITSTASLMLSFFRHKAFNRLRFELEVEI